MHKSLGDPFFGHARLISLYIYGKIVTFDRKVVETTFFTKMIAQLNYKKISHNLGSSCPKRYPSNITQRSTWPNFGQYTLILLIGPLAN